ncbi:MAG: hypothetical protein D6731_02125 [Planctomycetota bacterium]|nr:MAG: hypothetical protein D6731_02125 [Planctomycetota bacterium]
METVYVPEGAFDEVLRRHPRGVLLEEGELAELLRRARSAGRAGRAAAEPEAPVGWTLSGLRLEGRVEGRQALLEAEAEVLVLRPGRARVPLPLGGTGLRKLEREDGEGLVAVERAAEGVFAILEGPRGSGVRRHRLRWSLGAAVRPGDEPGSGSLRLELPGAAGIRLGLTVPGAVEATAQGASVWSFAESGGGATRLLVACGGRGAGAVELRWRPRRSRATARPYTTAEGETLYYLRRGVLTLQGRWRLEVWRGARHEVELRLPEGFVVRALRAAESEVAYAQRGRSVRVGFEGAREGALELRLEAERALEGEEAQAVRLSLPPLGFPGVERVSGRLGFAAGEDLRLRFLRARGLEREDAEEGGLSAPKGARLLRVYRRTPAEDAEVELSMEPVAPRVDLAVQAALAVAEREVRALALYRYEVEEGSVYAVRARLPAGYAFERAQVRDEAGREPAHQLKELSWGKNGAGVELLVELEEGLRAGQALLVTVQATRPFPAGLAGKSLEIPRFEGSPAARVHGHLGFAPDEALRLEGAPAGALTAVPAEALPRLGVDVAGLVLGYRVEGAEYGGRLRVSPKETRLEAETWERHRVHERVVDSEALVEARIEGRPVRRLELLLPAGSGRLAHVEAPGLVGEREYLGTAADGRERWRLRFDERKRGRLRLKVSLSRRLEAKEGESGALEAELTGVSLAGALRERGALAVYSSGSAEVLAEAEGLRAVEVTEVPAELREAGKRPLFAYTRRGGSGRLRLRVRRPAAAAVLSAVAERLEIRTSAGPDGTSRHTARWKLSNLDNQFFALRLPAGARLWSVVVDGEGVKPAQEGELHLVPLPDAGAKDAEATTELTCVYTQAGSAWGVLGRAKLEAPELLRAGEALPVLETRWELALPGDYRVLSVAGNLRGPLPQAPRPLLLSLGREALRTPVALPLGLLALLGLLLGASAGAQRRALSALAAAGAGAQGAAGLAGRLLRSRRALLGCAALLGCGGLLFLLLVPAMLSGKASRTPRAEELARSFERSEDAQGMGRVSEWAEAEAESAGAERRNFVPSQGPPLHLQEGDGEPTPPQPVGKADDDEDFEEALEELRKVQESLARQAKNRSSRRPRAKAGRPSTPPAGAPTNAPRAKAVPPSAPEQAATEPTLDALRARLGRAAAERGLPADGAPSGDFPDEAARDRSPAPRSAEPAPQEAAKLAGGGELENLDPNLGPVGGRLEFERVEPRRFGDLGAFGQVGLRSLVLDLPRVGVAAVFEREGGDAELDLRAVREPALVGACGLVALLSFVLAGLLSARRSLSAAALSLLGLGALTAVGVLGAGPFATPLVNAAAAGLLFALPALALRSLARALARRPWGRLGEALRAARAR